MEIREKLKQLIEELSLVEDLEITDMPDIGLYMDQMTTIIDSKLGGLARSPEDKILTKTMINNYTKAGLVMPPLNKKYYRDHLILLTLTYYLKNILSINDIKTLFTPVLNNICTRDDDIIPLDEIYSTFLELKNREIQEFYSDFVEKSEVIKEMTSSLDADKKETAQMFLVVLMLIAQCNAQKRLAEKIIDNFFKSPADTRD